MNWKQFKRKRDNAPGEASRFILGVDLGNASSSVSYFDIQTGQPELIDLSGGYGKPSMPTLLQITPGGGEWVFGEYAILNQGAGAGREVTVGHLMNRLGKKEYVDTGTKSLSLPLVLGLYIKFLLSHVKSIDPKAAIVGIVCAVPAHLDDEAREELLLAFKYAGYEKELIGLYADRQCLFSRYHFDHKAETERVMVLDLGSRAMRGGVYDVLPHADGVDMQCVSFLVDEALGTDQMDAAVYDLFARIYCANTNQAPHLLPEQTKAQLALFVHQQKELLFLKPSLLKPVRLYFNFAYPPFQQTLAKGDIEQLTAPMEQLLHTFAHHLLSKHMGRKPEALSPGHIDRVICTGGGFEMAWAKSCVQDIFPDANFTFYKNPKGAISQGAAILAARELGVIDAPVIPTIQDRSQLLWDIGVMVVNRGRNARFLPIAPRNAFWWQTHEPKLFLLDEPTDDNQPIHIDFYSRNIHGELTPLQAVTLEGLPKRPRGATKIKLSLAFAGHDQLAVTVSDYGFGALFPKTDYTQTFFIPTSANTMELDA